MTAQDLKNSILQLAIQGKLVEQRVEEGTAKELVEQIKAEKEQLIKEKKIKKEKPLPEITEDEIPFDIPESWEWVRLDNIVKKTIKRGKSPNYTDYSSVLVFAQKCNTKFGGINMELAQYLDEISFRKYPEDEYLCDKDIVINSTGTGTMGRVGIFHESDNEKKFIIVPDSHVTLIRVISGILPEYAYYFLKYHQPHFEKLGEGSTNQKELKADTIKSVLVPVPPSDEQRRIVAKIEELLPYVDQYDKAYSKLEVFNKKFPEDMQKSILQYAIQGKLVEQRPEEGTAEELYQQIQAEKGRLIKEGKIKKEKPLSEITEEEIPFEIPENWKWVRLGEIFQINPRNSIEDKMKVSFIPMTLLQEGYVSKFTFEIRKWGDVKKGFTHFKDDDIILAKITPCFQNLKSAIMKNLENGYGAGTTELHVLRCYKILCLEYFLWFVKNPYFMTFCEANMSGTAGQQRVGTDIVKNVLVPLPPLEEQKRIVKSIEEFIPYCHQLIK